MENEPKLNYLQTLLIGLGFMTCMLAWGMYNFYIPRILAGHYINDIAFRAGFFTGTNRLFWANFVMTLDNIAAILIQPYFGELSDRMRSKFGRRTPFLLIGIPISALALFFMPFAAQGKAGLVIVLFLVFMGLIIIFNVAMALYRAPVVALMPDLTISKHRSMANVLINVSGGVGTAVGFLLPTMAGKATWVLEHTIGYTEFVAQDFLVMDCVVFWGTGLFLLLVLGLFLIFVKEIPTGEKFWELGPTRIETDPESLQPIFAETTVHTKEYNTMKEILGLFRAKEKSAAFMFLTILFWAATEDAFNTNLSLWGAEYAHLPDSALASLSLVMGLFVVIFGYPGAKMSQKKGRIWTLRLGLMLLAIGYVLIILFQEILRSGAYWAGFIGIMFGLGIKACGGALLGIAAITIIWQLSPKDKIGTYTGLYYVFKQTGAVFSPLLIGGILSIFTPILGKTDVWVLLNPYCLILAILGLFTMLRVKRGEVHDELSENEIEELEKIYGSDDD